MLIHPPKKFWRSSVAPYYGAAAPSTPPTVSFVTETAFGTGGGTSTLTYTSASVGNPAYISTRRVILIARVATAGLTISSATIAGVAALVNQVSSGATSIAFISAVVTSGTTGTIVINYSGTNSSGLKLSVYNVDDSLLSSATPVVGSTLGGGGTSNTATVTTLAGGFVLLGVIANLATSVPVISPSTDATTVDTTRNGGLTAHVNNATVSASWSATATWTTTSSTDVMALGAYR